MSGGPGNPPPPDWEVDGQGAATEFVTAKALTAYGYDAANMAFKDSTGTTLYYLFAGTASVSARIAWFTRKVGASNNMPRAWVTQDAFNAIKDGVLNALTGVITAGGATYRIVLRDDGSGKTLAYREAAT